MAIRFTIQSGSGREVTNPAGVVIRLGVCSADALTGPVGNQPAELADQQDGTPQLGYGPLARADARAAIDGGAKRYAYKIPATVAGTISSVTETPSGTGPTITVAGSPGDGELTTPYDAFSVRVKVSRAGLPGVAKVDINLDGGAEYPYQYSYDVPAEPAATLDGTVDLTGLVLADLTATTFKITASAGGAQTVTFTLPTSAQDIVDQLNAGSTGITFSLIQGKYLRLVDDAGGSASSLAIDATSTGEAILGFSSGASNMTASGGASTITLPGTGLIITFPATSAYVLDTVYSFATTAPRHTQADLDTALAAINEDPALAFALVHVVQEPLDAADIKSYTTALLALKVAWEAQADKRFVTFILGAPVGVTDAALKTTMHGQCIGRGVVVCAGDTYESSVLPAPIGSFRTSPAGPLSIRCAAESLSEDPGFGGFGPLPACSMKHPNGATKARDENTATIKLGTSTGPGFTVIRSKGGQPYFVRGVTRSTADLFVDLGVSRMVDEASRILFAELQKVENLTLDLNADGTIDEADATAYELIFDNALAEGIVKRKHASRAFTEIDRTANIASTRALTVAFTIQERGQGEDIKATLTLAGTLNIAA